MDLVVVIVVNEWQYIYIYIYFFFPIFFSSCHVVNIFSLCEFPKLIQLKFHYQEFKFTVIRFCHEIAKWIDIVRFSVGKSMTIYLVLCCNLEYQISSIRSCPRSSSKERSLWSLLTLNWLKTKISTFSWHF